MSSRETRRAALEGSVVAPIAAAAALKRVRAKYIPVPGGGLRLASVIEFTEPVFNPGGLTVAGEPDEQLDKITGENKCSSPEANAHRASRRAKTRVFDIIQCNPELNWFVTLTYSPEHVDRGSYEQVYNKLKIWLGNRVARNGLKYVCVPEYHKKGQAIHWHMICNCHGMRPVHSGHYTKDGKVVFNLDDWKWGFSTAVCMGETCEDRDRVAKYVFKYMGKQMGQMIGGRYYLHGGKLTEPLYLYGDDPCEFVCEEDPKFTREKSITDNLGFREWSFI